MSETAEAEIDRLLAVRAGHQHHKIPDYELLLSAARIGCSPGHLRKMVVAVAGRHRDPWQVPAWMLPVWFAHGSISALHEDLAACREGFLAAGEPVPAILTDFPASLSTFRRAFRQLPGRYEAFARGGHRAMTSRLVYLRFEAERRNQIWQADSSCLPIWVRPARGRTPVRPWLIAFLDDYSRFVLAAMLCLAVPSSEQAAATATLAMSLRAGPDGGLIGGRPNRILWDNGPEFTGQLVTRLAVAAGFDGTPVLRYTPEHKGKVERFFRTFKAWAVAGLPGWSKGPRLRDGTEVFAGNPDDLLTDEQLWAHLAQRIDHYNWRRPHRGIGRSTPGARWLADPTPLVEVPAEILRSALLRTQPRVAAKDGILFRTVKYLAPDDIYADYTGTRLVIGYLPNTTSHIELFTPGRDSQWLCTAYPQGSFTDKEVGRLTSRRSTQETVVTEAARDAAELRLRRADALRAGDPDPGFATLALSRRTGPAHSPDPLDAAPAPDEEWLSASRRPHKP